MTSTTSSGRKRPLLSIYLWSLRGNRLVSLLFGFITVVLFPFIVFQSGRGASYALLQETQREGLKPVDISERLSGLLGLTSLVSVLLILILSFSMFSYLYSKRQVDLFHALPVTRKQLFFGKYLAGLTAVLVPIFVSVTLTLLVLPLFKNTFLFTFSVKTVLSYLPVVVLNLVMTFTLFSLLAVCAGTMVDFLLSLVGGLVLFPWGVSSLGGVVIDILPGFSLQTTDFWSVAPGIGSLVATQYSPARLWATVALWGVMFIGFLAVSIICYQKRKSEAAEQGFAFRLPVAVSLFFAQAALGVSLGRFAYGLLKKDSPILFISLCLLGALLVTPLVELIYTRSMKKVKFAFVQWAAFIVIFAGIYTVSATGGFGYASKVPAVDKIKAVSVSTQSKYGFLETMLSSAFGDSSDEQKDVWLEEKENKALAIAIQNGVLKERKAASYPYFFAKKEAVHPVKISYRMENGTIVNRSYQYEDKKTTEQLEKLQTSEEYKRKTSVIFTTTPEQLFYISKGGGGGAAMPLSLQQSTALYEAIRKDVLADTQAAESYFDHSRFVPQLVLGFAQKGLTGISRDLTTKEIEERFERYDTELLSIPHYYKNTMDLLISWGYFDGRFSLKDIPASEIKSVYVQKIGLPKQQDNKYFTEERKEKYYILGDENNGNYSSFAHKETKYLFGMYLSNYSRTEFTMNKYDSKELVKVLYAVSDESKDQNAEFLKQENGYFYYFEGKNAQGKTVYSAPFYLNAKDMERNLQDK